MHAIWWGLSRSVERGPHKSRSAFMDPDDRAITTLQCSHKPCAFQVDLFSPFSMFS